MEIYHKDQVYNMVLSSIANLSRDFPSETFYLSKRDSANYQAIVSPGAIFQDPEFVLATEKLIHRFMTLHPELGIMFHEDGGYIHEPDERYAITRDVVGRIQLLRSKYSQIRYNETQQTRVKQIYSS